jgi:hypothetical protein
MKEWIATYRGRIKIVEADTATEARKEGAKQFKLKDYTEVTAILYGCCDDTSDD